MYLVFIFIIGTVFGSFFYCMGTRLANNESLVKPKSHCTECMHSLAWFELIPVVSFIFLGGKCRYCHKKLSKSYIIYELLTGFLYLFTYLKFGFSFPFIVGIVLSSLLVLIFITDFKYMIILDSPLIVSGIILFIARTGFFGLANALFNLLNGVITFLVMLFIGFFGKWLFKKEALGGGDIKLSFIMGVALGFRFSIVAIFFSTFLALPYATASMLLNKDNEVPYGPFLISSTLIIYFYLEKFANIFKFFIF